MQTRTRALAAWFALALMFLTVTLSVVAAPTDRYFHLTVQEKSGGGSVNVNIPLAMAILDGIRAAPDNEFVTIKEKNKDIHILKANGNVNIQVRDSSDHNAERVDARIPLSVVDALFSIVQKNELDVEAALGALDQARQAFVVAIEDNSQLVRVWVDERMSAGAP
jgi:hypothetical protein